MPDPGRPEGPAPDAVVGPDSKDFAPIASKDVPTNFAGSVDEHRLAVQKGKDIAATNAMQRAAGDSFQSWVQDKGLGIGDNVGGGESAPVMVSKGDGPEDLGFAHSEVADPAVPPRQSSLGSTSTVPNGFMTEHPDESLATTSAQVDTAAEPDSPEGALDPDSPTTEPVSEPPPVIEADEHADKFAAQPQAEVSANSGPAQVEGAGGGPAPVGGVLPQPDSAERIELDRQRVGQIAKTDLGPASPTTPPFSASVDVKPVPEQSHGRFAGLRRLFHIGTPAPEPPALRVVSAAPVEQHSNVSSPSGQTPVPSGS